QASDNSSERSNLTLTLEQCLDETNIKRKDWRFVDPKLWDNNIEAPNNDIDPIAATTYVARRIDDYTNGLAADEELFWDFRHDFQGWNELMFKRANEIYARELKRILRFKGVFTGSLNMPPVEALTNLTEMDDYQRWPDEQLAEHSFDQRSVAYRRQQEHKIQGQHIRGSVQPTEARTTNRNSWTQNHATARDQEFGQQQEQEQRPGNISTNTIEHTLHPDSQRQSTQPTSTYNNFNRHRGFTPVYPQRPKGPSVPPIEPSGEMDPYKAVPLIEFDNERLDPATINVFVKMWDRDKKYTGKPYDLLDGKLKISYSICYHADIRPSQFHAVFPRILDIRAEEYYLHFVDQRMDTFLT
ncbi:hypothetical protein M011DRAFT_374296, partial [Sporormia fimetaria CBS 119925]